MIDYLSLFCTVVYPICLTLSYFVNNDGNWLRLWLSSYALVLLCDKILVGWLVRRANTIDFDLIHKK